MPDIRGTDLHESNPQHCFPNSYPCPTSVKLVAAQKTRGPPMALYSRLCAQFASSMGISQASFNVDPISAPTFSRQPYMTPSKPRVCILVNMISPARIPLYSALAEHFDLLLLHGGTEDNRAG